MTQLDIDFTRTRFDGPSYDPVLDQARLTGQLRRVWAVLSIGGWYTLREIAAASRDPEASVSAQLRHLRKPRFGAHEIVKRRRGDEKRGLWEYHLVKAGKED